MLLNVKLIIMVIVVTVYRAPITKAWTRIKMFKASRSFENCATVYRAIVIVTYAEA